ncbi:MAG: hypothetical protein JNM62_00740 [Flavobacteriales bacterium]|nr:hypothetical protein [Flavobacteriales bacterium]
MCHQFPFGQPVHAVVQQDQSPKGLFVLGVYASAVHARWHNAQGRLVVKALAIASEPSIFWTGDNADMLVAKIHVPEGAGSLSPAHSRFNGPSGKILDDLFLRPLGFDRRTSWLCDLLPESRMNPIQAKAIDRAYRPCMAQFNLPEPTVPAFRKAESNTDIRRDEILDELDRSGAQTVVVLGDVPIEQFIRPLASVRIRNLDHMKDLARGYGKPLELKLAGRPVQLIGLCHPRQAGRLGRNSKVWRGRHATWIKSNNTVIGG